MKKVLDQENSTFYVESNEMIAFIKENSNMQHNEICDFVRNYDICDGEFGPAYWDKSDLINNANEYNTEQIKWVNAFFKTHPWIERMMIVFND